jgi:hypothetical protein
MGHFTVLGSTVEEALADARDIKQRLDKAAEEARRASIAEGG